LSPDETEMGRGSKRCATPVYLGILNLCTEYLMSEEGQDIISFIPAFNMSTEKLKGHMKDNGLKTKESRKQAKIVLLRWLEQVCFKNILKILYEMSSKGPVKMFVGRTNPKLIWVLICFHCFIGELILCNLNFLRINLKLM
jgi:hypothetical protein